MRVAVKDRRVRKGRKVVIDCFSPDTVAVSVWGDTGNGPFPLVPFVPSSGTGKPVFVQPLFKRFLGIHRFEVVPDTSMKLIVMVEADSESDAKRSRLTVGISHGQVGKAAFELKRVLRNFLWSIGRSHDGSVRGS